MQFSCSDLGAAAERKVNMFSSVQFGTMGAKSPWAVQKASPVRTSA
jgi:hypothetical protein